MQAHSDWDAFIPVMVDDARTVAKLSGLLLPVGDDIEAATAFGNFSKSGLKQSPRPLRGLHHQPAGFAGSHAYLDEEYAQAIADSDHFA